VCEWTSEVAGQHDRTCPCTIFARTGLSWDSIRSCPSLTALFALTRSSGAACRNFFSSWRHSTQPGTYAG
jgi:hypothetical protein